MDKILPLIRKTYTVRSGSRLRHLNGGAYTKESLYQLDLPTPILPNGYKSALAEKPHKQMTALDDTQWVTELCP